MIKARIGVCFAQGNVEAQVGYHPFNSVRALKIVILLRQLHRSPSLPGGGADSS
jgi:hypothetical protein